MRKLIKSIGFSFVLLVIVGVVAFCILAVYATLNRTNPNSQFCMYEIYKQTNGTYQVWERSTHGNLWLKQTFSSYESAHDYRVKELLRIYGPQNKPQGELQ